MRDKLEISYQLPLKIMIVYLVATLILYLIGPFKWFTYKPVIFWLLQFIYILMLILGWQIGIRHTFTRSDEWTVQQDKKIICKLAPLLIINFFYEFINIFRKFNFSSFDIKNLWDQILLGFIDMGSSYNAFQENINNITGSQLVGGSIVTVFNTVWDFLSFTIVLLATYYFKKLSKVTKFILIINYIIIIAAFIGTGTNIGVFRLLLAWVIFFAIRITRGERNINREKWHKRKKTIVLVTVIAIIVMAVLFDKIMQSRGGILLWNTSYYNIGGIGINRESILFHILPKSWYMLLVSASGYLTQGYYGMSLCLRTEWLPTFGIGHSMAIVKLLKSYITDFPYLRTYQHRIEPFGWDEDIQWHTMYSWFANDIGFLGVAIIMFIFGLLFATAYKDSIKTNNPFAHVMVYFFSLGVFFIPCNNQLFQSTYVMFSFITITFLWLCTRGRRRITIRKSRRK